MAKNPRINRKEDTPSSKSKPDSVRLTPAMREQLNKLAAQKGMFRHGLIISILRDYLAKNAAKPKKEQADAGNIFA